MHAPGPRSGPAALVFAHARFAFLAFGAEFYAGGLFSGMVSGAAVAGLHLHLAVQIDLLAAFGAHSYYVTQGLLSDDPGATGTVPFAGGRLALTLPLRKAKPTDRRPWAVGLTALGGWDRDLEQTSVTYSFEETGWLSGDRYQSTVTHEIGQQTLLFGLGVTGEVDVFR